MSCMLQGSFLYDCFILFAFFFVLPHKLFLSSPSLLFAHFGGCRYLSACYFPRVVDCGCRLILSSCQKQTSASESIFPGPGWVTEKVHTFMHWWCLAETVGEALEH